MDSIVFLLACDCYLSTKHGCICTYLKDFDTDETTGLRISKKGIPQLELSVLSNRNYLNISGAIPIKKLLFKSKIDNCVQRFKYDVYEIMNLGGFLHIEFELVTEYQKIQQYMQNTDLMLEQILKHLNTMDRIYKALRSAGLVDERSIGDFMD